MITNTVFSFIGSLGGSEMLLIFLALLLLFGAKKIPELARGLGKGIRDFKEASKEVQSELTNPTGQEPNRP
ncbi:MAG: twin-arginine translocase TatA/TatE family subunit [Ferruginibacter sp.]|nr:twin-arginine translocase TatA/TatE family subunit [Cytophagales bacterium]